ncbi:hypothetical protein BASA60_001820 [Batrachochytrium salamandrivorans]|nr:hypothetical protein BASA60_001820 [Batrachochytrium salamandrivorans]
MPPVPVVHYTFGRIDHNINDQTNLSLPVELTISRSINNDKTSPSTSRSARYLQKYKQTRSNMFKPIIPRPTGFNPAIPRPTGVKPFLPQPTGNQSAIPQPTNSQSTDSQPTGFPSTPQINQHHMEANNQTEPQTSGHLYSEVAPLGLSASAIIMAILAIF